MNPSVTVVIAAHNAAAFIQRTVESALTQDLTSVEVIVVDDGSTDETQQVLDTFSDRRLSIIRQRNSGVSVARNVGLAAAQAPYVLFLDADDILIPNALHRMMRTLELLPECVACFGHHMKIAEDGSPLGSQEDLAWKKLPATDTLRHLIAKNFVRTGTICVRTEAARRLGGFNASLRFGEDWEFWCRLAVLSDFVPMPNDVVLLYRQRSDSATYRLRNPPLRQNLQAIDAVYANPEIQQRFSAIELKRRRRLAAIDSFWARVRNEYVQGRIPTFLVYSAAGAFYYPDSVLRPRLVYLFFRELLSTHRLTSKSSISSR